EGGYYGMQSFDQSLLQLVMDKAINIDEAMYHASSKQNFALLLEANDIRIDKAVRRVAAGSQQAQPDEAAVAAQRNAGMPTAVPPPLPIAPTMGGFVPSAAYPQHGAVGDFLPQIGGPGTPMQHVTFPGVAPAVAAPMAPAVAFDNPQQPRPQPGIQPDLGQGHTAA
ncbi:MAG: hypothetical protein JWM90_930, partial [Thermoleophilia bacterium]|nr:hypothetical protein [Thermoleophilia bacterium]